MTIALGAVLLATLLEAVLLLRLAATARARMRAAEATEEGGNARLAVRVWGIVIAVLVGMLGFALLGAFLVRAGLRRPVAWRRAVRLLRDDLAGLIGRFVVDDEVDGRACKATRRGSGSRIAVLGGPRRVVHEEPRARARDRA